MPKPYCVNCSRFLVKEKTGIYLIETFREIDQSPYEIYKVWSADLYCCPQCEYEMIDGYGSKPILEHHQENFKEEYDKLENDKKHFVY